MNGQQRVMDILRASSLSHIPQPEWEMVCKAVSEAGGVEHVEGYAGRLLRDAIGKVAKGKSFGGDRSAAGRYAAEQRWKGHTPKGKGGVTDAMNRGSGGSKVSDLMQRGPGGGNYERAGGKVKGDVAEYRRRLDELKQRLADHVKNSPSPGYYPDDDAREEVFQANQKKYREIAAEIAKVEREIVDMGGTLPPDNNERDAIDRDLRFAQERLDNATDRQMRVEAGDEARGRQLQGIIDRETKIIAELQAQRAALEAREAEGRGQGLREQTPEERMRARAAIDALFGDKGDKQSGGTEARSRSKDTSTVSSDVKAKITGGNLSQIAGMIRRDLTAQGKQVPPAARPYLDALAQMDKISDNYGYDSGSSVVAYLLGNLTTYKGPMAREIKAELKRRLKG